MRVFVVLLIVLMPWVSCFAQETEDLDVKIDGASEFEAYETLEDLFVLYQPYLTNIGPYKPIYFLYGANPEDSRFQISLKYQLLGNQCPLSKDCEWMRGIHLGYTQASSWDLKSDSSPFEDTSYMPEIFFLSKNIKARPGWLDGLFFQGGVMHESNGRAGDESRSTNYLYLSPDAIVYNEANGIGIMVSPKLVHFFNNSDDNEYIEKYRGIFELQIKAGMTNGFVLNGNFHFASKGVSTQLDLTYPLGMGFFKNLEFYVHAQYVNAYAETLLEYEERTEAFRFGIAIVR
jgi:outer membrane phospholipase A